jgi:hypothetical protein
MVSLDLQADELAGYENDMSYFVLCAQMDILEPDMVEPVCARRRALRQWNAMSAPPELRAQDVGIECARTRTRTRTRSRALCEAHSSKPAVHPPED